MAIKTKGTQTTKSKSSATQKEVKLAGEKEIAIATALDEAKKKEAQLVGELTALKELKMEVEARLSKVKVTNQTLATANEGYSKTIAEYARKIDDLTDGFRLWKFWAIFFACTTLVAVICNFLF